MCQKNPFLTQFGRGGGVKPLATYPDYHLFSLVSDEPTATSSLSLCFQEGKKAWTLNVDSEWCRLSLLLLSRRSLAENNPTYVPKVHNFSIN